MTLLYDLGLRESSGPLRRIRSFAMTRLISFNSYAGDLRWTIFALVLRVLGAACAFGHRQLSRWAGRVLRRAWQGARFAADITAADTMVAAGGR
jgi:hypothetical protein